ncbi:MAG: hypothetical protein CVV44_08930 [Spirochaetae bacterium HGW-Spirochaetae-1]|jgi:hypothetical protein|nr:MAG: hypothetical protein CVV44_08930 [Spirochaetae bacterium HGW-Spirochaetae-1]
MKFRIGSKRTRKMVGFEGLLPDIISELNIEDSFIVESLKVQWESIVGNILATHSMPDRIFKKILFIAVDHSVYANELIMMKDAIMNKIRETTAGDIIYTIKVEIKRLKWDNKSR